MSAYVGSIEAAKRLGITRVTVVRAILRGRLKGKKEGRDWRVLVSSLARYKAKTALWERVRHAGITGR